METAIKKNPTTFMLHPLALIRPNLVFTKILIKWAIGSYYQSLITISILAKEKIDEDVWVGYQLLSISIEYLKLWNPVLSIYGLFIIHESFTL